MSKEKSKAKTVGRNQGVASQDPDKPQLPVQAFQDMERRDEDQILTEMKGELIEEFVYSIQLQGKRVTNLSYAGVKEAVRRRGNLEILEMRTEETEKEIRALVRVRDLENRIDVLGASSAEKDRPFAYVIAINKAERNAFAKLISAKWYSVLIKDWLERHLPSGNPRGPEPEADAQPTSAWEPKVPIIKEPLKDPAARQFPLIQGTLAVGMVNILEDGSEVSIVPEGLVYAGDPAIANFLLPRILDAMSEKNPSFEYQLVEDGEGLLKAILIRGELEERQVKELCNTARWAFSKAMERAS